MSKWDVAQLAFNLSPEKDMKFKLSMFIQHQCCWCRSSSRRFIQMTQLFPILTSLSLSLTHSQCNMEMNINVFAVQLHCGATTFNLQIKRMLKESIL